MIKNIILLLCLITLGSSSLIQDTSNKKKVKITQQSLLGEWHTGKGIKYHVDANGKVISEQPLASYGYLMIYRKDSTMWHDGHKATLTWMVFDGNRIIYDQGTEKERIYKVEKYTKDTMQVFGPFKKDGKRFDPNALFRLIQYR